MFKILILLEESICSITYLYCAKSIVDPALSVNEACFESTETYK